MFRQTVAQDPASPAAPPSTGLVATPPSRCPVVAGTASVCVQYQLGPLTSLALPPKSSTLRAPVTHTPLTVASLASSAVCLRVAPLQSLVVGLKGASLAAARATVLMSQGVGLASLWCVGPALMQLGLIPLVTANSHWSPTVGWHGASLV